MTQSLAGRRILLGVSGSIAAYKAVLLCRQLLALGAELRVVLTQSAERFVGPVTFAGVIGRSCEGDMWDGPGEPHVELSSWAEQLVLCPATADLIARLATGRADDLLTATFLSTDCPVLIAPAMHPRMWSQASTQRNVRLLSEDSRVRWLGPVDGVVASGDRGLGRMVEPEEVSQAICNGWGGDLNGRHIVVTAGPTLEDIDPVRFIGNRSSGKMGFAIAHRAAARGARVTLIAGPVHLPTPAGAQRIDIRSARQLEAALNDALGPDLSGADAVVMAAAVGDFRAATQHDQKWKRGGGPASVALAENPDLLKGLGERRSGSAPLLVGFAVETARGTRLEELARAKLRKKQVDLVVANHAEDSFGRDDNLVLLVTEDSATPLDQAPKHLLAERILDWLAAQWQR